MGDYDSAARKLIKLDPAGFLRWLLPNLLRRFTFTRWLDSQLAADPNDPERRVDALAELVHRRVPWRRWAVNCESQARPDYTMLERAGEYVFRVRRKLTFGRGRRGRYRVLCVVLNLTGPSQPRVLDMRCEEVGGKGVRLELHVVAMRSLVAGGVVSEVESGRVSAVVLGLVPLMRGGDSARMIGRWRRVVEGLPVELRADCVGLALVFANLGRCQARWQKGLRGMNTNTSRVVEEWRNEGRAAAIRELIERVLRRRFGEVPNDVVERLREQTDETRLNRLFDSADAASSLAAFRRALNGH